MRNPKWTRDEMILALDLYFELKDESVSPKHEKVIQLSEIINKLDVHPKDFRDKKFRNANGIALRLSNYKSVDPDYKGTGMSNGGKQVEQIWNEFSGNRKELSKIAEIIKKSVDIGFNSNDYEDEEDFREGKIVYRIHRTRERNTNLVNQVKREALLKKQLYCSACGFDFYKVYGDLGKGFIECHHDYPISEYVMERKTSPQDLKLLCSNCHSMIHRKRPWITVDELKSYLFKKQNPKD